MADACRRLHAGESFVNQFDMFEVQANYLERVRRRGFRLPPGYLDHARTVERIRDALSVRPVAHRPCNNDLLAANFIDDGQNLRSSTTSTRATTTPTSSSATSGASAICPSTSWRKLVDAYDGAPSRSHLARDRLWGLMSQYGWTLWASIQDATSPIDFDFWSWGMEKYERAEATFGRPDLEELLADVMRAD